jgi:TIR domain/Pentapeptide repeats (8 copies)
MDRDEAIKLLTSGEAAIAEWNRRRAAGEATPNLSGANLSHANLSGTDLSHADLSDANLSDANLSGAHLHRAQLHRANLNRANLDRAQLNWANLNRANLSGAVLSQAGLMGTNLSEAELSGAGLSYALCAETVFANVDLSQAMDLESVRHIGQSTIGTDTLIRSKGGIPDAFLRGCGLPDVLINYLPSLIGSMSPIQFYSCFISYSSKNQDFAERLHADLQGKGVRTWFDREDLKIGARIRGGINEAIRVHDKLLLVLTEQSLGSDWVEGEVEAALERERREKRTVLFPIQLDDSIQETQVAWASHIRQTRQIGDFRGWENHGAYQTGFARLLRDLTAEASVGTGDRAHP